MKINSRKRGFMFLALLLMIVSLPVVIWLSKQQQETRSGAASPDQLEAEGGTLSSSGVSKQTDSQASGGQYVAFGSQTQTITPTSTPTQTAPVYGSGINMDSKANIQVRNANTAKVSHRFRASTSSQLKSIAFVQRGGPVYSGGDGGTIEITVQTDDGTSQHNPSGNILATYSFSPGNPSGNWEKYTFHNFSSPPSLTAGQLYHIVFRNIHPQQDLNWISVNETFVFGTALTPRQPHFSDLDYAVLAYRNGSWIVQGGYTAPMDLAYANGVHDGNAYFGIIADYWAKVSGANNMVRENFTVSGGNRVVKAVWVRLKRISSGTSPLIVTLESSSGSVIESVSVPASLIEVGGAPVQDPTNPNHFVYDTLDKNTWIKATFTSSRTLTNGSNYHLKLSTAQDTEYLVMPIRSADDPQGPDNGGGTPWGSYSFTDGSGQKTTNGSTWVDMYQFSPQDLQFYFE